MIDLTSIPVVDTVWKAERMFDQGAQLVECRKDSGVALVCNSKQMVETFYQPVYVSGDSQLNLSPM